MTGRVHLTKDDLRPIEATLFELDRLNVSSFLFATGVHALRLQSPRGHIVVLPYQGQQIWDALFEGRRLTMKSFFSRADILPQPAGFVRRLPLPLRGAADGHPGPGG